MSDTTPAGWYSDGITPDQDRFWDGTQWTDLYQPKGAVPPPPGSSGGSGALRRPSAFGLAIKGYWNGTTALLRGDAPAAFEATGRAGALAGLIPVAKVSVVFAFAFLGYLGWLFGLPGAILQQYLGLITGAVPAAAGGIPPGALQIFGRIFDASSAGGVLAGAFFVGLGLGLVYFALRALGVVLSARLGGGRIGYLEALGVVGTAHLLTPYPIAIAALFCLIPGSYGGGIAIIVLAVGGIGAIVAAEAAIGIRTRDVTGTGGAVIRGAAFGGASLLIVAVLTYWFGSLLATAGFQTVFGGLVNTLGALSGLGSLGGGSLD